MVYGVAAFVPVEVRPDGGGGDGLVVGQEAVDDGPRVRRVLRGEGDFDTVAGGEDDGFGDAVARSQIGQGGGQRLLAEGQALPHLDRRCLVAHSCGQQLHCLNNIMAALRPRHPAVTRRHTMAR